MELVLLLKQKLFSLLEYMSSTPVLSGVGATIEAETVFSSGVHEFYPSA